MDADRGTAHVLVVACINAATATERERWTTQANRRRRQGRRRRIASSAFCRVVIIVESVALALRGHRTCATL